MSQEEILAQVRTRLADGDRVALIFFATWCTKCTQHKPEMRSILDNWKASGTHREFFFLNVDECPDFVEPFRVEKIPSLCVIRGSSLRMVAGWSREKWVEGLEAI